MHQIFMPPEQSIVLYAPAGSVYHRSKLLQLTLLQISPELELNGTTAVHSATVSGWESPSGTAAFPPRCRSCADNT